jgi:hypothetical protein
MKAEIAWETGAFGLAQELLAGISKNHNKVAERICRLTKCKDKVVRRVDMDEMTLMCLSPYEQRIYLSDREAIVHRGSRY